MPGQVRYRHLCHGGGPRQPCDQRRHAQCQPGAGLRQRGLCSGDRDDYVMFVMFRGNMLDIQNILQVRLNVLLSLYLLNN